MSCSFSRAVAAFLLGLSTVIAVSADAQVLTAVQSRKSHGALGPFDIQIDFGQPVGGAVTVEPRKIGAGHNIVFQFDAAAVAPTTVEAVDSLGAPIGTTSFSTVGPEVTVTIAGIPDNSRVKISLLDGAAVAYATASVGFLMGDVDKNGAINSSDISAVKARSGATTNGLNFQFDVGTTGAVNSSDISAVKSRAGRTLAPAGQGALAVVLAGTGTGTVASTPAGISCPGTCSANFALPNNITLNATPNANSTFTGWDPACAGGAVNLTASASCTATFAAITYTVTPSAGTGGTINPSTVQSINKGSTTSFTITPNIGFSFSVGGTCGGSLAGNVYTTNVINGPCTVTATFTAANFNVTPSAGTNGAISPNTVQSVPQGATKVFTLSPNANYTPSVGGTCGGTLSGLTFTTNPISANCTVSATFVRNSYTVTPSAGANGTISPSTPQTVLNGATKNFTVTPAAGYTAIVGGTCGGTLSGTTYTTNPITGLCSVSATFVSNTPKYVSTTGNDSTGAGTLASPWRTISKGISMLAGGETLIVRNGTYSDKPNFILAVPSGIATRYTTIMAETPMQVRIQSTGTLGVADNQLGITGNYITVDGFIFDMAGTANPAFIGEVNGNFNTVSRSIFKRSGDIDAFGGLLEVTGSDNLMEDVAGTGACRYCFSQGGSTAVTQRNIWRRVVGRFDYSNSTQAKATFATQGNDSGSGVTDTLYQNVIAIDGQNPGNLGGLEKVAAIYASKNAINVTIQGSLVLNEGAATAGIYTRELSNTSNVTNSVVWDLPTGTAGTVGVQGNVADHLLVGGNVGGAATDLNSAATASSLKPGVNPSNLLNNSPGAAMIKQYGVSGTRWGQTGYNQLTTVDVWPWPFQDRIKAVFSEANNVPAGSSPPLNNSLRGFSATGNAIYGGPITLTSYVWEYLGTPCPSTVCATYTVTPSAGANGTISPATPQTVLPGNTVSFTVTPSAGFIASVGGTCGGTLAGTTFTTSVVSSACTVVASFSQGQTYFVGANGSDANSCTLAKSASTPKLTVQGGRTCLAAGDALVLRDGTYSGSSNAMTNLPNGAAGNYITIKAENEGNVILTAGLEMAHTNSYLIFQGLRFQDATEKVVLGNHIKFFRNEFKGGCPFGNCANTAIGTNDFNDTSDILFEDNWWHGSGSRYNVLVYNSNRVVIRRGIIRHDGGWTDDKGDPEAGMNFYNSTNSSAQNVIILDSTLTYWTWQSAFYNVFNSASPNSNANNSWYGIIALNNTAPGFPDGASLRFDGNAAQVGHIVRDALLWDSNWGMNVSYQAPVDMDVKGLTIGQTTSGSVGYGIAGGSGGTKTFSNVVVTNMSNADFSGVSATFFDSFNNGSSSSGTGKVTYNPRTNGLLYLPRIEAGSALKTAGSGGTQIGAQIVTRTGAPGSMFGDPSWNTDTGTTLWPFPNEARIKKEMCTDAGITRGYCAKPSLTNYIMNYLGNGNPYP